MISNLWFLHILGFNQKQYPQKTVIFPLCKDGGYESPQKIKQFPNKSQLIPGEVLASPPRIGLWDPFQMAELHGL